MGSSLGMLDSERAVCTVMHGGWSDGVVTAALTATHTPGVLPETQWDRAEEGLFFVSSFL